MSQLADAQSAVLKYLIRAAEKEHGGAEIRNLAGAYAELVNSGR